MTKATRSEGELSDSEVQPRRERQFGDRPHLACRMFNHPERGKESKGGGGDRRRRKRVKQAEKFIDHGHLTQFDYFAEGGRKRKVERVEDTANFSMFGTLAKWRQGLRPRRLFLDACSPALE